VLCGRVSGRGVADSLRSRACVLSLCAQAFGFKTEKSVCPHVYSSFLLLLIIGLSSTMK